MKQYKQIHMMTVSTLIISIFSFITLLNQTEAATKQTAIVQAQFGVNVRNGAGTQYQVIGTLKNGKTITVYSKTKSGWSEIYYKGKKAYVATKYLTFHKSVAVSTKKYKNIKDLKFPQITGLNNHTVQNRINKALAAHAKKSYKTYVQVQQDRKADEDGEWCQESPTLCDYSFTMYYKVTFNQDGKLSILIYNAYYGAGAPGVGYVTSYNFKTTSGKQMHISDILTSQTKYKKVKHYAYNYMINYKPGLFDVKKLSDVLVNKNTQFQYTTNGIYLIFQEYEVTPYTEGHTTIKIPSSVYQ